MSKVNIPKILRTQAQFSLDELKKKDWGKMPIDDLMQAKDRLYQLYPPDIAHNSAIRTIHERFEQSLKPLAEKHKYGKIVKDMLKLQKKFEAYEVEKKELMRGYVIQEINGFMIEKKLK